MNSTLVSLSWKATCLRARGKVSRLWEEFSKNMQTTGVPLRVIWIASGFDERDR
jgi:hypothetical protein